MYAVGGSCSGGRGTQRSVEVLDLGAEAWRLLAAEMRQERKYMAVGPWVCSFVGSACRSRPVKLRSGSDETERTALC